MRQGGRKEWNAKESPASVTAHSSVKVPLCENFTAVHYPTRGDNGDGGGETEEKCGSGVDE